MPDIEPPNADMPSGALSAEKEAPMLHMPATAVAVHDAHKTLGWVRTGKVHLIRSGKPAADIGRNRRTYRVACGVNRFGRIELALPARVVPFEALCRSCWTDRELDRAGVSR